LILGINGEAAWLAATLGARGSGYIPLGHVQPRGTAAGDRPIPVLGELPRVRRLIHEHAVDCLFIASSGMAVEDISQVAQVARQEGVEVRVSANLAETLASRLALLQVGPVIALSLRPVRLSGVQAAAKRAFDLAVASVALLLCLPLLLL